MRPPRQLAAIAVAAAAAVALVPASASARAAASIGAYPALYPAFSPTVTDYVSRCHRGRPLLLSVHAPPNARIQLDRRRPVTGSLRASVRPGAGQRVTVRIKRRTYNIRCLPKSFPRWSSERHGKPQASWYVATPAEGGEGSRFVTIFDTHGAPVWWMRQPYKPMDAKLLPDGNLAWSTYTDASYATRSVPYEEHRLDGATVRKYAAVGIDTDSHELQLLPNGDHLVGGYVPRAGVDLSPYGGPKDATVTDAEVQEVSPAGEVVWRWSSKDHVDLAESKPFMAAAVAQPSHLPDGRPIYDIVHLNSIEPAGDSVLISLRHTDAVYKVSKATGAVEWKLGGTRTDRSLAVAGEPEGSLVFGGQHDARLLPDGTLTLHDNRTNTTFGPRALRFRIDEAARTATKVEEIADPDVILSLCCGSARRLPGGNWVMSWGFNGLVTELTPAGKRVFGLRFRDKLFSYRAVPVRAGEGLSAGKLRAGMDAMHPRVIATPPIPSSR
jgi:hypothetical protein